MKVKLTASSPASFRFSATRTVDLHIDREDWDDMSDDERHAEIDAAVEAYRREIVDIDTEIVEG
jgi:hypothetical protein